MTPKGRYGHGGILQTPYKREPLILNKVPKAQAGADLERTPIMMDKMIPLQAQLQTPTLDTTTLAPMQTQTPPAGGGNAMGVIGPAANMVADVGSALIDGTDAQETDTYGLSVPESSKASASKGALKGAASGATAGAVLGPWGAAIGGVIGGAAGALKSFVGGKKLENEYDKAFGKAKAARTRQQDANIFQTMSAKDGMKFGNKINQIVSSKTTITPIFKTGGKLGENVIAGGKLHKEKNNLGNGDKGIPVINTKGIKTHELEKEEWVTTAPVTKEIESMAAKYDKSGDDGDLENLGKFVASQLMSNTLDKSDRYGLGGKS